jgi:hypothetical protein
MNLRSIILQIGTLAFCISIIALSMTGFPVLKIIIISFIVFIIVTFLATIIVAMFSPSPKNRETKLEPKTENNILSDTTTEHGKYEDIKIENGKDRKDESRMTDAKSTIAQ